MNIKRWNGKVLGKREWIDMATISFMKDSVLTNESADKLLSQMSKVSTMPKHKSKFDIEDNMREGRRLLTNLLSKRQK